MSAEAVKIYRGTYADFECLDSVVQQQYIAHNLCVLPVSLQFRRPDIVGSASGQAEARAHHALTRICNKPREKEETANQMSNRGKGTCLSFFITHAHDVDFIFSWDKGKGTPSTSNTMSQCTVKRSSEGSQSGKPVQAKQISKD